MTSQHPIKHHESGQLRAGQVTSFKIWLKARGLALRAARSTDEQSKRIHFWVCIPATDAMRESWVTVREDDNDKNIYALTHTRLRALVATFANESPTVAKQPINGGKVGRGADRLAILVQNKAPVAADRPLAEATTGMPQLRWNDFIGGDKLAPLTGYLADLRDDFAASCPLQPLDGETPLAFANRRWVYAQAMIESRPA